MSILITNEAYNGNIEWVQSLPTDVERHNVPHATSLSDADGQSTIPVPAAIVSVLHDYKDCLLTDVEAAHLILDIWRCSFKDTFTC